ncbi:MAG: hypothetical protein K1X31_01010 [Gemmatimonadaceae bacterium]|nr:hypothetical protein [Gemmatimonadaceae bacterium]
MRPMLFAFFYGMGAYAVSFLDGLLGLSAYLLLFAFLFGIPFGIGYTTARGLQRHDRTGALLAPLVPLGAILLALVMFGWEGWICIAMAAPLVLAGAFTGGLWGWMRRAVRGRREPFVTLTLPFLLMPVEAQLVPRDRAGASQTSIDIAAPPARVWEEIASVDSIRPEERAPALYTAIGFPAPVAATLDRPGVGGVRIATFAWGIRFEETVTAWVPGRELAFAIRPDSIPDLPTLDPHVRIGGEHFDVLEGRYRIEPLADGRVRLHLESRHRVRTRFNAYAGAWADLVMGSVQRGILHVIRARAEAPAAATARPSGPAVRTP